MLRPCLVLAALLLLPAAASASAPGYARATSQLEQETKPALFSALNLLDGKETTVWCEGAEGDGVGEGVLVGFRGAVEIDEVRITTGDNRDPAAFKAHNRVKELVLKTTDTIHNFVLVDAREPQSFKLDKPIESERVLVEIVSAVRGEGEDNASCLSDVIFLSKGKPLDGAFLADSLLHYERGRAKMMGTWYAGPDGARDRFLDFYADGTFHYRFKPFDPEEKAVSVEGEYAFDGARLKLKLPGKGWVEEKAEPKSGAKGQELVLESKALKGTLAGTWSDKP